MFAVKGTFRNGVARPEQPVEPAREGQRVLITFIEKESPSTPSPEDKDWDDFLRAIDECAVETGVPDLAHQHDHYLYGKPKKES